MVTYRQRCCVWNTDKLAHKWRERVSYYLWKSAVKLRYLSANIDLADYNSLYRLFTTDFKQIYFRRNFIVHCLWIWYSLSMTVQVKCLCTPWRRTGSGKLLYASLTWTLDGGEWLASRLGPLTPDTRSIYVRAGLDALRKRSHPNRESKPIRRTSCV
jgi:hypothetical protein